VWPDSVRWVGLVTAVACLQGCSSEPQAAPATVPVALEEPVREVAVPAPAPKLEPSYLLNPPEGFVDLPKFISGVKIDIRYHTADNFTGAPLVGYGAAGAWLLEEPAKALQAVAQSLESKGLGLLVYDAYRPRRGTLAMVAWAQRTSQVHLLDGGYIARRSGHNHGHTVDLTLYELATGQALDMGTPWDTLTEASHTRRATGQALDNRLLLKTAMEAEGWGYYFREWWHFRYPMKGTRSRDVPYSCFEPVEGQWRAPPDWNQPDFAIVAAFTPQECQPTDAQLMK
jgi:D-alanyl-D-alanine dipeptidase